MSTPAQVGHSFPTNDSVVELGKSQGHIPFDIQASTEDHTSICLLFATGLSCTGFWLDRWGRYLCLGIIGLSSEDSVCVCIDVEFGRDERCVICTTGRVQGSELTE